MGLFFHGNANCSRMERQLVINQLEVLKQCTWHRPSWMLMLLPAAPGGHGAADKFGGFRNGQLCALTRLPDSIRRSRRRPVNFERECFENHNGYWP